MILVFSDVHGNLPAFERMLKEERNVDQYICLGDLINYGPWSNECVDLACSLNNVVLLMGNHEQSFLNGRYEGANKLVKSFFNHTFNHFDRFKKIQSFLSFYVIRDFTFLHSLNSHYTYPDTEIVLDGNYVIGHSHHQFDYKNSGFILYNPGSVGQCRNNLNRIEYMLYDPINNEFRFKHIMYQATLIISEMKRRDYPAECINYYISKLKD
jgi:predicted phosphodiesterase